MNPVVEAQLKEFGITNSNEGLSQSDLFEVYCTYNVCCGVLNESIDPFKVHLKGNEFGLDGIAILIDGELCQIVDDATSALEGNRVAHVEFVFIQAKTSESVDYGEASKFLDAVFGFFPAI
jgi:hypothetical protein